MLDGQPLADASLAAALLNNYGHFTSFCVLDGRVQGLGLHLQRLQDDAVLLFGADLDLQRVRAQLRRALDVAGVRDAWVRVTVFSRDFDMRAPNRAMMPEVLVSVGAVPSLAPATLTLKTVEFERTLPSVKHAGMFGLFWQRRQALGAGFDDALFVDVAGQVLEGSTWNIGFVQGDRIVWPEGPALSGTRQRLLRAGFDELGVEQCVCRVERAGLGAFDAAFICNARGQSVVARIDDRSLDVGAELAASLEQALATQSWQAL